MPSETFFRKPMPTWGGYADLNFQEMFYYVKASEGQEKSWDDVPEDIRKPTIDWNSGGREEVSGRCGAQYEFEVVYGSPQEDLSKQGDLHGYGFGTEGPPRSLIASISGPSFRLKIINSPR